MLRRGSVNIHKVPANKFLLIIIAFHADAPVGMLCCVYIESASDWTILVWRFKDTKQQKKKFLALLFTVLYFSTLGNILSFLHSIWGDRELKVLNSQAFHDRPRSLFLRIHG